MREPHAKGDASALSLKNKKACLHAEGNEEPSQVLLLSCKVNTDCNSQAVFFSCNFQSQVQCTSENTPV